MSGNKGRVEENLRVPVSTTAAVRGLPPVAPESGRSRFSTWPKLSSIDGPFSLLVAVTHQRLAPSAQPRLCTRNSRQQQQQPCLMQEALFLLVPVPPEWISRPRDLEAVEGQDVFFPCRVSGVPEPMVTWRKLAGKKPIPQKKSCFPRFFLPSQGLKKKGNTFFHGTLEKRDSGIPQSHLPPPLLVCQIIYGGSSDDISPLGPQESGTPLSPPPTPIHDRRRKLAHFFISCFRQAQEPHNSFASGYSELLSPMLK